MRKPIDQLKPEDAIPLLVRIRGLILGKERPDGFTRLMFSFSLFAWLLLTLWNAVSYFVLLTSDIIKQNKGFSVDEIIIRNGQNLGFNGEEFLASITSFYFNSLFVWLFIFVGLALMYRKKRLYTFIVLGGLGVHFIYMFIVLGFQYFIEDVSFFDKILYAILIVSTMIHSLLMNKEKDALIKQQEEVVGDDFNE